jgi:uncharacterized membrane protein YeaQ/YmgE (transglycosylase-associated protein family)
MVIGLVVGGILGRVYCNDGLDDISNCLMGMFGAFAGALIGAIFLSSASSLLLLLGALLGAVLLVSIANLTRSWQYPSS